MWKQLPEAFGYYFSQSWWSAVVSMFIGVVVTWYVAKYAIAAGDQSLKKTLNKIIEEMSTPNCGLSNEPPPEVMDAKGYTLHFTIVNKGLAPVFIDKVLLRAKPMNYGIGMEPLKKYPTPTLFPGEKRVYILSSIMNNMSYLDILARMLASGPEGLSIQAFYDGDLTFEVSGLVCDYLYASVGSYWSSSPVAWERNGITHPQEQTQLIWNNDPLRTG